jgi:hypothetical protein
MSEVEQEPQDLGIAVSSLFSDEELKALVEAAEEDRFGTSVEPEFMKPEPSVDYDEVIKTKQLEYEDVSLELKRLDPMQALRRRQLDDKLNATADELLRLEQDRQAARAEAMDNMVVEELRKAGKPLPKEVQLKRMIELELAKHERKADGLNPEGQAERPS